jgi:hypothetical protein
LITAASGSVVLRRFSFGGSAAGSSSRRAVLAQAAAISSATELAHGFQGRVGVNEAAVEVDFARIDQPRLHALRHHPFKQPLEKLPAPLGPRLGKHAVVRDGIGQVVAEEPAVIQPHRRHPHQFPLAGHVVEKEQQHQLHHDDRVHRFVAVAPVEPRHFLAHKIKPQHPVDRTQRRIPRDQPPHLHRLRPHFLLLLVSSHHRARIAAFCVLLLKAYLSNTP